MQKLRDRDPDTLARVVEQHARRLYRAARGFGLPAPDAEDLTQEVFLTFLATLDRFEGRSQLGTWLFGILSHKVQERRRADARAVAHDPSDAVFETWFDGRGRWARPPVGPDALVEAEDAATSLADCLAALPALQRDVFHLRQVEELPAREVCKILGPSVTHVAVLLHRARVRLRECLSRKGWMTRS